MHPSMGLAPPQSGERSTRRQSLALRRAESTAQNDTFCVMPARMRCLCFILSGFLMISLMSAIINSMQTSSIHSESYCRSARKTFSPEFLCPPESIIYYYECCKEEICCGKPKIWMIIAVINVLVSIIVCVFYIAKCACT